MSLVYAIFNPGQKPASGIPVKLSLAPFYSTRYGALFLPLCKYQVYVKNHLPEILSWQNLL